MAITISGTASTTRTNLGLGTAALATVGTAANNVLQLDSSGKVPALNGAALTNVPGGGILQVAESSSTSPFTSTATTYTADIQTTITPTSTASKIMVLWSDGFQHQQGGLSAYNKITRTPSGGSEVNITDQHMRTELGVAMFGAYSFTVIDAPNTTTALTYQRWYKTQSGLTIQSSMNNAKRVLILMEIKV